MVLQSANTATSELYQRYDFSSKVLFFGGFRGIVCPEEEMLCSLFLFLFQICICIVYIIYFFPPYIVIYRNNEVNHVSTGHEVLISLRRQIKKSSNHRPIFVEPPFPNHNGLYSSGSSLFYSMKRSRSNKKHFSRKGFYCTHSNNGFSCFGGRYITIIVYSVVSKRTIFAWR